MAGSVMVLGELVTPEKTVTSARVISPISASGDGRLDLQATIANSMTVISNRRMYAD
jgi:hypothetical protein